MSTRDSRKGTKLGVYTPIGFMDNAKAAAKAQQPVITAVEYRRLESGARRRAAKSLNANEPE